MTKIGAQGLAGIERDALYYGIHKGFDREHNRTEWSVTCKCGVVYAAPFTSNSPPSLMAKKIRQQGWACDEHIDPACPACVAAAAEQTKRKPKTMVDNPKIGPDLKLTRRVMAMLDQHFDEATHRYKGECSDALIANAVGCTAEMVAHVRIDGGYGEIEADPLIHKVQDELDMLMDEIEGVVAGMRNEFTAATTSAIDRFKNEVLTLKAQHERDIAAATDLFKTQHAAISAKIAPLMKKAG